MDGIREFIGGLEVSDGVKKELNAITPKGYTGLAAKIVDSDLKKRVKA